MKIHCEFTKTNIFDFETHFLYPRSLFDSKTENFGSFWRNSQKNHKKVKNKELNKFYNHRNPRCGWC